MTCRASLLALAASLEATAAELCAKAATIRAQLEANDERPASDVVNVDTATAMLGSKRKAREFFARAEREGFAVRRMGHAAMMDRAEWDRALEAFASKRAPSKPAPPVRHNSPDDESPASIFARAGLAPSSQPQRGARGKRAA